MRDGPQMQRVFSMMVALDDLLAEKSQIEMKVFPRNIERIIIYGLEIPIKRMLPLTIREAFLTLCILRGNVESAVAGMADRELYGLLHIGSPCNIIFIRDKLSPQVHNYVLAHEIGHFLADVYHVQQLWIKTLPEQKKAIERAFAWREGDARLELYAYIKGLPPRPQAIISRGQTIVSETVEREIQADLFARELIAPWDVVAPLFQTNDQSTSVTLLYEEFGLPRKIASNYLTDLKRYFTPQPNAIEGLFAPLLTSSDKSSP
jgi:hypothetical protein